MIQQGIREQPAKLCKLVPDEYEYPEYDRPETLEALE